MLVDTTGTGVPMAEVVAARTGTDEAATEIFAHPRPPTLGVSSFPRVGSSFFTFHNFYGTLRADTREQYDGDE